MDLGIKDRVALVCGASMGLGYACAERLAAEGAKIILCSRHPVRLQAAADSIQEKTGAQAAMIPADLSEPEEIEKLVSISIETFGHIDILIHNNGGPPAGRFFEQNEQAWGQAYELLLMSYVRLCRLILPSMQARNWGRVVTITSRAAREPTPELILSGTFRAGILALTRVLAKEVAGSNVLINAVLPGAFNTERLHELLEYQAERKSVDVERFKAEAAAALPPGRFGEPEELASIVAYLCSEANGYLTGAAVPVDGAALAGVW